MLLVQASKVQDEKTYKNTHSKKDLNHYCQHHYSAAAASVFAPLRNVNLARGAAMP